MNEIINKILLAGDKFMPKMHLKQPGLHIVFVVHSIKIKERIKNSRYINQNEPDNTYFQHDMAYGGFLEI